MGSMSECEKERRFVSEDVLDTSRSLKADQLLGAGPVALVIGNG